MLETLWFSFNAIAPIILLITLGYYLKKIKFFDEYIISKLNAYVFKIALPLLFFYNIYLVEDLKTLPVDVILFSISGIVVFFLVGIVALKWFRFEPGHRAVVHQGLIRTNFAMIGISLAIYIGDQTSNTLLAFVALAATPVANILSVLTLTAFPEDGHSVKLSFKALIKTIYTNPLIIAAVVGLIFVVIKTYIVYPTGTSVFVLDREFPFIWEFVQLLAKTASPIALIALGGQFDFSDIKGAKKPILVSVLFRNILIPFVMVALTLYLSMDHPIYLSLLPAMIAMYASPVAVSSVVMVDQMGGDVKVAGQIVVWTTIISGITVFIILSILRFGMWI
jgi:malate permease and related proteins